MRLIDASTAADIISKEHGISLAELVDTFAMIPTIEVERVKRKKYVWCDFFEGTYTPFTCEPATHCPMCGRPLKEESPCGNQ